MVDVKSYDNLRVFLKEFVHTMKSQNPEWTMTAWSSQMGLKALTSITMIINGQRNCGKSIEEALVNYYKFNSEDERHFRLLIKKDKLRATDPVKNLVETELKAAPKSNKNKVILSEENFIRIIQWQYFALRQLGRLHVLPDNEFKLREMLSYKTEEPLLPAIRLLEEFGLMKRVEGGFVTTESEITTAQDVSSEPVKRYHESMSQIAAKSLRVIDPSRRSFQGRTLPIKKENLSRAKALIEKFQSDFDSLLDDTTGDSVYQLNVQFFPLGEPHV